MPSPVKVTLEVGKQYLWCKCGKKALCDTPTECVRFPQGASIEVDYMTFHAGTRDKRDPTERKFGDPVDEFICTCKLTRTPPFCDGSHKTVKDE